MVKEEALKNGPLLVLTNMQGCYYDPKVVAECTKMVIANKPHIKAEAIYGMNALQQMVFNGMVKASSRNFYAAKSREDALRWLLEQA